MALYSVIAPKIVKMRAKARKQAQKFVHALYLKYGEIFEKNTPGRQLPLFVSTYTQTK